VRASTDTYARGSASTQAAYAFIRHNFSQKITPEQIASKVGISSRTLQDHFKKETGRTLSQEITRLRLEHACDLLKQTDLKVSTVAHETGFASYAHFCSLFGRQFQMTPGEYREAHAGRTRQNAPRIMRGAAFGPQKI
jgi:transcriptional regulator GlxA family with amidase domain